MNYPNGSKPKPSKSDVPSTKNYAKANLGLDFEAMINDSNKYYLNQDLGVIYKKPTPVKVTKVEYPARSKARITEAFYQVPSTTDYNGIYKGKYIDFEAKSCNGKSFSFQNIYEHQVLHLEKIVKHGGIAFLLILFRDYKEVFLLKADLLVSLYKDALNGGKKSISYDYFNEFGYKVKLGLNPTIDYLEAVDKIYF